VIISWLKFHFRDFSEKMLVDLNHFLEQLASDGYQNLSNQIKAHISRQVKGEEIKKNIMVTEEPPEPIVPKNIFQAQLKLSDISEEEIARQLTIQEFTLYSKIEPTELLNKAWNTPKLRHRSPNVLAMIHRFNVVSEWVAYMCVKPERARQRAKVMTRFIRIGEHLRSLQNFNTLMAIVAGLNNTAVYRLKYSREDVFTKYVNAFSEMEKLMSSHGSFKYLRDTLHKVNPPCIPYLGVYLTDLTFIEDGSAAEVRGGLINWAKRKLIYNVILEIQQYQNKNYNFVPVMQISTMLESRNLPRVSEPELFKTSLLREPRGVDKTQILY